MHAGAVRPPEDHPWEQRALGIELYNRGRGPTPRVRVAGAASRTLFTSNGTIPAYAGSSCTSPGTWRAWRDHPRGCGEQHLAKVGEYQATGPSPRVWGAGARIQEPRHAGGTIPAHAGSRSSTGFSNGGRRDHPRVGGEHREGARPGTPGRGPSPRARGAGHADPAGRPTPGTIPARAGSSRGRRRRAWRPGDHLRACGEQRSSSIGQYAMGGPSPHVRGAGCRGRAGGPRRGTIPACAGSSQSCRACARASRDHPRMCGEQGSPARAASRSKGPSPHVRGAVLLRHAVGLTLGTIPACAGSSSTSTLPTAATRDHPRMCAEQTPSGVKRRFASGPSPHVRGAGKASSRRSICHGTIPACAGSRCGSSGRWRRCGDHPRMCGEQAPRPAGLLLSGASFEYFRRFGHNGHAGRTTGGCSYLSMRDAQRCCPASCRAAPGCRENSGSSGRASPWTWGAAHTHDIGGRGLGTIFAYAGSSSAWPCGGRRGRDHPRKCGEQADLTDFLVGTGGSSPRVRGAEWRGGNGFASTGTIPARAGSSGSALTGSGRRRGRPRAGGEQSSSSTSCACCRGPSPRARGAGHRLLQGGRQLGAIPACAGSRLVDLQVFYCRELISGTFVDSGITAIRVVREVDACMLSMRDAPRCCSRGEVFAQNYRMPVGPLVDRTDGPRVGTTPTDAGSRPHANGPAAALAGHPRVRGGAVEDGTGPDRDAGTIPAGVGSSVRGW